MAFPYFVGLLVGNVLRRLCSFGFTFCFLNVFGFLLVGDGVFLLRFCGFGVRSV